MSRRMDINFDNPGHSNIPSSASHRKRASDITARHNQRCARPHSALLTRASRIASATSTSARFVSSTVKGHLSRHLGAPPLAPGPGAERRAVSRDRARSSYTGMPTPSLSELDCVPGRAMNSHRAFPGLVDAHGLTAQIRRADWSSYCSQFGDHNALSNRPSRPRAI